MSVRGWSRGDTLEKKWETEWIMKNENITEFILWLDDYTWMVTKVKLLIRIVIEVLKLEI